jgi:hypothetical protein
MIEAIRPKPGEPELGQRFLIPEGGDGDQRFLGESQVVRLTEAQWFPGYVRRDEAMLFVVEEGAYAGRFVALTTKSQAQLRQQITDFGWASVVVHVINNPTFSFDGSEKDADPIGMSAIVRVDIPVSI